MHVAEHNNLYLLNSAYCDTNCTYADIQDKTV
jgi:hypothetical protein